MNKYITTAILWLIFLSFGLSAQGPVACFSFQNGSLNDDIQGLQGQGFGRNTTTGRDGTPDGALNLVCSSSYHSLGSHMALKSQQGTISIWVNGDPSCFDGTPDKAIIYTGGSTNGVGFTSYALRVSRIGGIPNQITAWTGGTSLANLAYGDLHNDAIYDGQWEHVVMSFDWDTVRLYLNGRRIGAAPKPRTMRYDSLSEVIIGFIPGTPYTTNGGGIDDLQLYHRALSPAEVMALYQAPSGCVLSTVAEVSEAEEGKPTLYPNPTDGSVWASHHEGLSFTSYKVYDIAGREVLHQAVSGSQVRFDMTGMARGVYVVLLTDERGRESQHKLILE